MQKSKIIWFTLAGMLAGYLLVHPFAMLAYFLGPQQAQAPLDFSIWGHQVHLAFSAEMLAMGGAFAFMGGVAGLGLGLWYVQKERWVAENLESQRRLVALETLKELMVTLAHHIRNANMVIGGFSSRLIKQAPGPEAQHRLEMIRQASREIDAVIDSLESLTEIEHARYTGAWETKMIDLKKELAARLQAAAGLKETLEDEPQERG
ncbi:MAG: hypothetical protein C4567_06035 [Deltaproteobacteria bacterium]|nr:MAG: hypothetical protein C4567_06035 [Deltaproteobacteria bacterium]